MKVFWWLLWPTLFIGSAFSNQKIRIDPDGGYTGIVVKISKKVPENECPNILTNIKVRNFILIETKVDVTINSSLN